MVATKTIELAFDGGLSQKMDALWLAPGSAAAVTNLIKIKGGSFAKRVGYTSLSTFGYYPGAGQTAAVASGLRNGKRLANFKGSLVTVAQDVSNMPDAVWTWDDSLVTQLAAGGPIPMLVDRMPEVYCYPPENIGSVQASTTNSQGVANSMDVAVCNGYEVHCWTSGYTQGIFYCVRNAATGEYIVPPQRYLVTGPSTSVVDIPKLIVCGTSVVMTYSTGTPDYNIYAVALDCSMGAQTWGAAVRVNAVAQDATNTTWGNTGSYDSCAAIGAGGPFGILYQSATPNLILSYASVTGNVVTAGANGNVNVAPWTTDSKPTITSVALRVDANNAETAFAFSYATGSTTKVVVGLYNYPTISTLAAAVEIYASTPGPFAPTDKVPIMPIVLERTSLAGPTYGVMFSRRAATWVNGANVVSPWIAKYLVQATAGSLGVVANHPRATFGVMVWSRILLGPIYKGTVNTPVTAYVVGYVPSNEQGSFFLLSDDAWLDTTGLNGTPDGALSYSPMRVVANLSVRQSNVFNATLFGLNPWYSQVPTHIVANPFARGFLPYQVTVPKDTTPLNCVPCLTRFDMLSPMSYQSASLGENLVFAGGVPSGFDGAQQFELGYPVYPCFNLTATTGGGVPAGGGEWSYILVYQWTDTRGQVHTSPRSVPFSIALTVNQKVVITAFTSGFSSRTKAPNAAPQAGSTTVGQQAHLPRRNEVNIVVYRTTNGGDVYYQLPLTELNSVGAATVSIQDTFAVSDATLQGYPLLYGDGSDGTQPGNILDDECAPPFQALMVHQNRIWGVDGPRVWLSKALTTGIGSGFNEASAFSWDDGPGPIVAIANMDGNAILFKSDRIAVMSGLGPADNGTGNDLTPPARISSDCGCIDWRSVVVSSDGIYFQSAQGRRKLGRDLSVTPLPTVEDIDAAQSVTTAAIVHPSAGRLLFAQNTDDVTYPRDGSLVANDYVLGSWAQHALVPSVGMVSAVVASATLVPPGTTTLITGDNLYWMSASGQVYRENVTVPGATPWEDASAFVPSVWQSPWIKSDGLQGWSQWAMVRLLFRQLDPAGLTVTIAYDYAAAPSQTLTFTAAQIAAFTTPQVEFAMRPNNQRAQAMQVTITDAAAPQTVTGQGFLLEGLRVDYNVELGGFRQPVNQQG